MILAHNYHKAVTLWLARIRNHVQAHGSDLVDDLITAYPGNGAAVDAAPDVLRDLEAAEIVVRHTQPAPTLSQRAFDSAWGPGSPELRYYWFRGQARFQPEWVQSEIPPGEGYRYMSDGLWIRNDVPTDQWPRIIAEARNG